MRKKEYVREFKSKGSHDIDRLIRYRKQGKFINIKMFNFDLLEELNNRGVFSRKTFNGKAHSNYRTMISLASIEYTLTVKQKKLYNTIFMQDIAPYLDKVIAQEEN